MKRIGKNLLAVGLALSVLVLNPGVKAQAQDHFDGCRSLQNRVYCTGELYAVSSQAHTYYSTESGMSYCNFIIYAREHEIRCANVYCNKYIASVTRTCWKAHQKCSSFIEFGICQY